MEDLAVAKHANAEEEGSDTGKVASSAKFRELVHIHDNFDRLAFVQMIIGHRLHIVMETSFDITPMADHI